MKIEGKPPPDDDEAYSPWRLVEKFLAYSLLRKHAFLFPSTVIVDPSFCHYYYYRCCCKTARLCYSVQLHGPRKPTNASCAQPTTRAKPILLVDRLRIGAYSRNIFVFRVIYLSVTKTRDETEDDDKIYFYLRYIATLTIIISRLLMSRSLRCKCILIYIFKHYIFYILTAVSFYLITVALHCAIGYKVIPLVITDITSHFSNL